MRNTKIFSISLPERLARKAEQAAQTESRTKSGLFREALRHYLDWRDFKSLQKDFAKKARKSGIRDEGDVEKMIDEIRG